MRVYNFGSLNIDYVYEVEHIAQDGETISALNQQVFVGGKGLNQSIALAKAGATVEHVGMVGNNGSVLKDTLSMYNVGTTYVKETGELSGHAIIQIDQEGNNAIIVYPGANSKLEREYIDSVFEKINVEDIILLQNETSNVDYIVSKGRKNGNAIFFNPSPIADNINDIDLNDIQYIIINETEGYALTNQNDPNAICEILTSKYPQLSVVLTLGSKGALLYSDGVKIRQDAFKSEVADTTAAGDTFTGYFIKQISSGEKLDRALKISCLASSITISEKGAANSIPLLEDVLKKERSC